MAHDPEEQAARELAAALTAIAWTPNEHGLLVLICRECLTPLLNDEAQQILADGELVDVIRAALTHVNLRHGVGSEEL